MNRENVDEEEFIKSCISIEEGEENTERKETILSCKLPACSGRARQLEWPCCVIKETSAASSAGLHEPLFTLVLSQQGERPLRPILLNFAPNFNFFFFFSRWNGTEQNGSDVIYSGFIIGDYFLCGYIREI